MVLWSNFLNTLKPNSSFHGKLKKKYLGPNLLKLRVEDKHAASFQDVKMFFLRRCQIWTRHIGHIYQKSEKFVSSKILF